MSTIANDVNARLLEIKPDSVSKVKCSEFHEMPDGSLTAVILFEMASNGADYYQAISFRSCSPTSEEIQRKAELAAESFESISEEDAVEFYRFEYSTVVWDGGEFVFRGAP